MESRAKYTLVGGAIILIVTLFVVIMVWLGRARDDAESSFYLIYFRKFSLAGLQENSLVTMRGIKVGIVHSLEISRKDIELTKVTVRLKYNTPIKQDTEALIERNLLTGLSSIDLIGSSQDSPFLLATDNEEFPVIPEGKAALASIQDNLPNLFEKTSTLVNRLNSMLSPQSERDIQEILGNLRLLSETLSDRRDALSQSIDEAKALTSELRTLVATSQSAVENLAHSVGNTSKSVSYEAQRISNSAERASQSVTSTFDNYRDPEFILKGHPSADYGPGEER